ncbi:MAG: hypothetical protein D3922_07195, partial [Candidatus Electrothrix sp. AR1]|nr:hypothetical protein [Candidatus Electrothrix sp. AR1]
YLLKYWNLPKAHGEHAGNSLIEIYYFNYLWWNQLFRETGWTVVTLDSNKLFYTGSSIMDSRLTINIRSKLSRVLGSSCNIFVLWKSGAQGLSANKRV